MHMGADAQTAAGTRGLGTQVVLQRAVVGQAEELRLPQLRQAQLRRPRQRMRGRRHQHQPVLPKRLRA